MHFEIGKVGRRRKDKSEFAKYSSAYKPPQRLGGFCHVWLMCSPLSNSSRASSHFVVALSLQLCLGFGCHFHLSLSLLLWLPRPAETRKLRHSVGFVTLDQTQWSILAGLWFWLSWAQSCWGASVRASDPRGSEDGYSRSEKTSDPTLFLCSLMIKTWSWVRHWVLHLLVSFAQMMHWPFAWSVTLSEHWEGGRGGGPWLEGLNQQPEFIKWTCIDYKAFGFCFNMISLVLSVRNCLGRVLE